MATDVEGLGIGRAGDRAMADSGVSNAVLLLLIWLIGTSGFLLLLWGSKLTFLLDDWEILVYRPAFNAHAILDPHGENIAVGLVLVYKALLATFGMSSALPFRAVSTSLFLLSAGLLFALLRKRVGQWPALAATAVILFLGAGYEDLLWSFQIGYFGSMVGGLGALLALERRDRRADALACALLTVSVLFSSLGLPFVLGVALEVLWRADRWRRLYVVAVPAAVYALWWLGWGHTAESALSLTNVAKTPVFVLNGLAATLASAFGLATPPSASVPGGLDWGRPLAVAAIGLVIWRLRRLGGGSRWFWITLAIFASFWILAGLNQMPGRSPESSRYQYVGVVLALLPAAELLRGIRVGPRTLTVVFVVAAASVASNVYYLHQSYVSYRQTSQLEKADLGALDIARDTVEPGFVLSEELADTVYVHIEAGPYFSARDEYGGSPAYDPAELAEAPAAARFAADKVLFGALRIDLVAAPASAMPSSPVGPAVVGPGGTAAVPAGGCVSARPEESVTPLLSLPPDGAVIRAGGEPVEDVKMTRFAVGEFPIDFERGLAAGEVDELRTPPDRSSVPWKVQLDTGTPATVCGLTGGAGSS